MLLSSTALVLAAGLLAAQNAQAQAILNPPGTVPAQCTFLGGVATCVGDLSDGIDADGPPLTDLVIQNLTATIGQADPLGDAAVDFFFDGSSDISLTIDTGGFGISNTSTADDGIDVRHEGPTGNITVVSTGDISADEMGFDIERGGFAGNIAVTSVGEIATGDDGFEVTAFAGGNIWIDSTGNVASTGDEGFDARVVNGDGNIVIYSTGNITSENGGINANVANGSGNISIASTGNVIATDDDAQGIRANVSGNGNIMITADGDITTSGSIGKGIAAELGTENANNTGNINITALGEINTAGTFSEGILAEHQGSGNVTIEASGPITTQSDQSEGIDAEIDGTGIITITASDVSTSGNQAKAIEADVNGDGTINVTSNGSISTLGVNAIGIDTQIDGNGNVTISSTGPISTAPGQAEAISAIIFGTGNATINSQGTINSGEDAILADVRTGGNIDITSTGNLSTNGLDSEGIDADVAGDGNIIIRSMGNITTQGAGESGTIDADVNGSGNITINSMGDLTASGGGDDADGISATVFADGDIDITSVGNISTSSRGIFGLVQTGNGSVNVTSTGSITTTANDADAIQILAGITGNTTITHTGNIDVIGEGSDGINAVAVSGFFSTINLSDSSVRAGSGSTGAIKFGGDAGTINTLNTFGDVSLSSASGRAILTFIGDTTVNNYGSLNAVTDGAIELGGGGTNAFNNMAGATFHAGAVVDLGVGNLFTNDGVLSPGGSGNIATTTITGDFVQSATGELLIDVGSSDLVDVSGTGQLAGNVRVQVESLVAGPQQETIFTAAGGTTDLGLGLFASPALQAVLDFPNANDVVLSYEVDFTAPASDLNRNQTNLVTYLDQAFVAGPGDLEELLIGLLNGSTDLASYGDALNQLLPEIYLYTETASLFAAQDFSHSLFSCSVDGAGATAIEEGRCTWLRASGGAMNAQDTFENTGFGNTYGRLSAGVQFELAPHVFANFGVEYERAGLSTDSGARSDSNRILGGVALKYQQGPWLLGGAVSGGIAGYDTARTIGFGGFAATANSTHDVGSLTGQLRAAYEAQFETMYVQPSLDVMYTYLDRSAVNETAGGAANLSVSGASDGYFAFAPKVEIGRKMEVEPGEYVRPFMVAGFTYFTDNSHDLTASFTAAPSGLGTFATSSSFDRFYVDLAAGVEVLRDDQANLTVGVQTNISQNALQFGAHAKGAFVF